MAKLLWIVLGVLAVGGLIVWAIWVLWEAIKATCAGVIRFVIFLFGRKLSPKARLIEPPELAQEPKSDPSNDLEIKKLSEWNTRSTGLSDSSWPKWQPLWIGESEDLNSATASEIDSLSHNLRPITVPYELLDRIPAFAANGGNRPVKGQPPEPSYVSETYAAPTLSLPL